MQGTTFVQFFINWKAKKNFEVIQKFLIFFPKKCLSKFPPYVRNIYAWSFGHSDPDPSSVSCKTSWTVLFLLNKTKPTRPKSLYRSHAGTHFYETENLILASFEPIGNEPNNPRVWLKWLHKAGKVLCWSGNSLKSFIQFSYF